VLDSPECVERGFSELRPPKTTPLQDPQNVYSYPGGQVAREIGEVNCGDGPEAERQGEGARREGARERSQQDAR
jgi:hypothetical protein